LDFVPPFSLVPKYKALDRELSLKSPEKKTGNEVDFTSYPVWLRLTTDVRPFFCLDAKETKHQDLQ
jgi:hypothetical protein